MTSFRPELVSLLSGVFSVLIDGVEMARCMTDPAQLELARIIAPAQRNVVSRTRPKGLRGGKAGGG